MSTTPSPGIESKAPGSDHPKESLNGEFDLKTIRGLTVQEVAEQFRKDGPNELPSSKPRSVFRIAVQVVLEPVFLILVACGAIYISLGDTQDAVVLLGFVFLVTAISLYQEHKTERTLEALRDLSSPRARVIRDGQESRIAGREVVVGDIVMLAEGDRVPADSLILSAINLSADESFLTGESVPVRKAAVGPGTTPPSTRPGGDDLPFVYSGTLITQGSGVAKVLATGMNTELGKVGKSLQTLLPEKTRLQKETAHWVWMLAIGAVLICLLVVVLYGFINGNWTLGLLSGLTLAMAILPNELPVVLTIFMAIGAWRISKHRVLTRRVPVIETLGSTTVLCVDKTGTVTMNRMSVKKLFVQDEFHDVKNGERGPLPEKFHGLVEFGILASQRDPFDPMERALNEAGERHLADTEHLHADWVLVRQYPLSRELLALSHVWRSPDGGDFVIAAKGAPEAIADLCHLDQKQMLDLTLRVQSMAAEGLRILGVAQATFSEPGLPDIQHDFRFEFLGIIGLEDPVRPGVPAAIQECNSAGVRVVMITGDYPGTAIHIARQIGLLRPENCLTGIELEALPDDELQKQIQTVNVFARIAPEQKLRLVKAMKANTEIVAMTGDGVNDAPALKAAHIGIAMGGRGTDVAREAAALVLLDDDFSSIVQAIRLGRRIFDNLRKAVAFTIATHLPIVGLTLVPLLMKWPMVLLPFHVAFLHLIIDPACSIILEAEPEESTVMQRPPRDPKEPLFDQGTLRISVMQGLSVMVTVLAVLAIANYLHRGEFETRALTFTTLVFANLALIFTNRSWTETAVRTLRTPNPALWIVTGGTTVLLGVVLFVPYTRTLFRFAFLHLNDFAICLGAALISIVWFEAFKLLRPHWLLKQRT